jgi:hypothetical protein
MTYLAGHAPKSQLDQLDRLSYPPGLANDLDVVDGEHS